jgi:NAD(P)-dependent dehydrogenase (short-subunit alcohol dehydrogenase family)
VHKNKKQFHDTWAIILGGSSGFGLATAKKLANHGMNIAVLYRETAITEKLLKQELELTASRCGITILPFNINALSEAGKQAFIQQFTAHVGKKHCVKLLLHSIARGNLKPLFQNVPEVVEGSEILSIEDIQITSYAMSTSLFDWARLLLNDGLFNEDARIIGLTSEGANKYWQSYAAVAIAKASLVTLATYMAVELGKFGLKTNVIQAGITETPSLKRIPGSGQLVELATTRNPLGRMTRPEDVANAVYLLCTDEAFWINGTVIHVDGGEHCC